MVIPDLLEGEGGLQKELTDQLASSHMDCNWTLICTDVMSWDDKYANTLRNVGAISSLPFLNKYLICRRLWPYVGTSPLVHDPYRVTLANSPEQSYFCTQCAAGK